MTRRRREPRFGPWDPAAEALAEHLAVAAAKADAKAGRGDEYKKLMVRLGFYYEDRVVHEHVRKEVVERAYARGLEEAKRLLGKK